MNNNNHTSNIRFAFFGTDRFAVFVLEKLQEKECTPSLILTTPDKPQGRKMLITPSPVKVWAEKENIPLLQPEKLSDPLFINTLREKVAEAGLQVFIVASYGKIIPEEILTLPPHETLNIHPSLLPKLRGASPIQTALLEEDGTGSTIMKMDKEMDHGSIVFQKTLSFKEWPLPTPLLSEILAKESAEMLLNVLPEWIAGNITPKEQDHDKATFTKKITKADALIDLSDDAEKNYRKICAYAGGPEAYFFTHHKGREIRVIIKDARLENNTLVITRVVPEGKKEMSYEDFQKGLR